MPTPDTRDFDTMPVQPATLIDLLRWRATQQPAQRAYTFLGDGDAEEAILTYAELDRQARAIGACLQSLGVVGGRVLLLYPSGVEYIAAFFGCLYAGAIAVPVYPPRQRSLPRLLAILADAQAKVALTTAAIHATVELSEQSQALPPLHWLVTDSSIASWADRWQMPVVTGDTLAFLQYTSGSTGAPRGVMLSHGNLLHNQRLIQQAMGHTERSIILGWLPLYHDMGLIGNVLQPLYVGGASILMSPMYFLQQPGRWLQAITRYHATTSGGPNFAYDLCVRKITPEQRARLDLSSWSVAFNGAEPVHAATLERFATTFAPYGFRREALYPCYGLAEATLIVSGGDRAASPTVRTFAGAALEQHWVVGVETGEQGARTLVGCGHALQEQQIVIVDPESLLPCPTEQVGEIWVKGRSIAWGYWNRPEESVQTFQARLADSGDGPFLRTGDLGFLDAGELFVTGRIKDLLIIRGRNLYPQDIELTVQQSHPALRPGCGAACAVEVDDEERLVVVQEVESRQRTNLDEVVAAVRRAVAEEHAVQVEAIVLIQAGSLPKTSSGKIQRYACQERFLAGTLDVVGEWRRGTALETNAYVAPRTPVEEVVAAIWAEVLECEPVSLHANFFALGGDSLHGTQIVARIREALQVQLPLDSLFDSPTVAALCEQIEPIKLATSELTILPLQPVAHAGDLPLSSAQQRLWFLEQMSPDLPVFNIPLAVRLQGALNEEVLTQSLNAIVRRHEALRTTIHRQHGQPLQRIAPAQHMHLPVIDLQAGPASEREVQARWLATTAAKRPFDLSRDPLLRAMLLRLDREDHLLLLTTHHIASDFWSMRVLLWELSALYEAFAQGQPAPLPDLALQYADFVHWQRQWFQGEDWETHLDYWRQQLAGAPAVLPLLTDRPRPKVQGFSGALLAFALPQPLTEALEALSRQQEVTLFTVLLAAFKLLLWHYAGQASEVVVGAPIAGRTRVEVEGLIGYFLNTLALRTDLTGDPSFRELLRRVRRVVLDAYAHQELPFEKLVETLRPQRSLEHMPVFQVVFNFQNVALPTLVLPGVTLSPVELDLGTVKHDLTLYMRTQADGLVGTLAYNTDLFDAATIVRMRDALVALLRNIVADPEARLGTLGAMLTQAERQAQMQQAHTANASNLVKLGSARRQALRVSPEQLISSAPLQPGEPLPLLVQPALEEVDLCSWAGSHLQDIETMLLQHGAVLFRGFKIHSASAFMQFASTVTPRLLDYIEGASPRLAVTEKVYTSTEYPAAYAIAMHNELSYSHIWPGKIFFCCLEAPQQGGETPLADSRKVFALLTADIQARFQHRGVKYVRNFHGGRGSGQSWQSVFMTTDRAAVEAYCRTGEVEWQWQADGGLWLSQVRPASITHPKTGASVWFNQAHQWHLSNLEADVAQALGATLKEDALPMQAYYGDGAPLEATVLEAIRTAYRQVTVTFPWQAGDVLLLDNMLTAHGRMPFVGPRKILVAMGEPVSLNDTRELDHD